MRNPHVVALHYRLETAPSLIFDNPPPLEWETDQVTLCLAEDMLTCKMKAHYAAADAARAMVDPLLRSWELHVTLSQGMQIMHFVYQKPELIDLDPPPPGTPQVIQLVSIESAEAVDQVTVVLTQPHYPQPPTRFTASQMSKLSGTATKDISRSVSRCCRWRISAYRSLSGEL